MHCQKLSCNQHLDEYEKLKGEVLLEVVTKSEVGQSAVWLLNTLMEDLWDGDDGKIYTNFISRYYILWARNCAIRVTQLVHPITHEYSIGKKPIFASPNPYLRISMFLALLYVMGLATAVSIQLELSHPSPNIIQLTCPYLTCISKYLPTDVLHTQDHLLDLQNYILMLNKIFFFVSQRQHIS